MWKTGCIPPFSGRPGDGRGGRERPVQEESPSGCNDPPLDERADERYRACGGALHAGDWQWRSEAELQAAPAKSMVSV